MANIDSEALTRDLAAYDELYLHNFSFVERSIESLHLFEVALLVGYSIFFCGFDEAEVSNDALAVLVVLEQKSQLLRVKEESSHVVESLVDRDLDLVNKLDHIIYETLLIPFDQLLLLIN